MNTKVLYLSPATDFSPNIVPVGPHLFPEESFLEKKSCVIPLFVASGHAASSSSCGRHWSMGDWTSNSNLLPCWPLNRNDKQKVTLHLSSLNTGKLAFSRLPDKWILRMSLIQKVLDRKVCMDTRLMRLWDGWQENCTVLKLIWRKARAASVVVTDEWWTASIILLVRKE